MRFWNKYKQGFYLFIFFSKAKFTPLLLQRGEWGVRHGLSLQNGDKKNCVMSVYYFRFLLILFSGSFFVYSAILCLLSIMQISSIFRNTDMTDVTFEQCI